MTGIFQKYMNIYLFKSYAFHYRVVRDIIKNKNGFKNECEQHIQVGVMDNKRTQSSQIKEEKKQVYQVEEKH